MNSLLSDLRYAAREVRKRPGFTLTAVLSLALGIGATSAMFSVIYAVLLDPFPYPDAARMMEIRLKDKTGHERFAGLNGPEIQILRKTKSLEDVVAMGGWNLTTTDGDLPEDVRSMEISPEAANHWGTRALMGRWLMPSDAPFGQDPQAVVVLSYPFWQRYYVGDPNVVGRTIQLVHKPYKVVGVMPPRFRWGEADLYLPLKLTSDPKLYYGDSVKLRPGVTVAQANAELQPLMEQFAKQSPDRYPEKFRVNLRNIIDIYARPLGPILYLLFGAVAALLLIGCANVSILLLARGTERQHELAVRAAVGASRWQMIRQLLTESLSIAVAGTALGVLLAWKSLALITLHGCPEDTFAAESVIRMNLPVLLFSIGLAFATTMVFGLVAGAATFPPRPCPADAKQHEAHQREFAGPAHAQRDGGSAGGAHAADAGCGERRGQRFSQAAECEPWLRSALCDVRPDTRA